MTDGRRTARAALLAAGVVAVDQLAKALVRSSIGRGEEVELVLGIELTNVRNRGVAFGLLAGGGTVVTVVIAAALIALAAFFVVHGRQKLSWLPTGLLLGGALGNLLDRLREGAVTDFIDFPAWPAFNVADIAITFGVLSLLFVMERRG